MSNNNLDFFYEKYKNSTDSLFSSLYHKVITKNIDLNSLTLGTLYSDFVFSKLLDKNYLKKILKVLVDLKKVDNITSKLLEKGQKKIEKILYANIKGPVNSSLLSILHKKSRALSPYEDLFVERFNNFKKHFLEIVKKNKLLSLKLDILSTLLKDKDKDFICYLFINHVLTDIYDNILYRNSENYKSYNFSDSSLSNKEKEKENLSIKYYYLTKASLLTNLTAEIDVNIYSNTISLIIPSESNNNCSLIDKIKKKDTIPLFDSLFESLNNYFLSVNVSKSFENNFYPFYKYIETLRKFLLPMDNENKTKDCIWSRYAVFKSLGDKKKTKGEYKLEFNAIYDLLLALLASAETCELITLENENSHDYESGHVKTTTYIKLDSNIDEIGQIYFINKKLDLPFISPPKHYYIDNSKSPDAQKFDHIKGGYHIKKLREINYFSRYRPTLDLKSDNSSFKLSTINYLQSIPLHIHTHYLDFLLQQKFSNIPIEYTRNINLEDYFFSGYSSNKGGIKPSYLNMTSFLFSIFIADIFQGFKIYFTNYFDQRHRLYLSGNPLNFQSDKLFRDLFLTHTINNNISNKEQNYLQNYLKHEKNFFHKKGIILNPSQSLLHFDANSSIFQIGGGLSFNTELLLRTKVFSYSIYNKLNIEKKYPEKLIDVYQYICNLLKKNIYYSRLKKIYEVFYNLNKDEDKSFVLDNPDAFIAKIQESINRKMIKSHLMPFSYNKTKLSMIKTYKSQEFINSYFQKKFKNPKLLYKIISIIITTLLDIFKTKFGSIYKLKDIFKKLSSVACLLNQSNYISLCPEKSYSLINIIPSLKFNNTAIYKTLFERCNMSNNNIPILTKEEYLNFKNQLEKIKNLGFYQSYLKHETKTFRKQIHGRSLSVSISTLKLSDKNNSQMDSIKNRLGLYPNATQFIDSLLLYGVISYCELKKIPLLVIHDSFSSDVKYFEEIRQAYSLSYYEILGNDGLEVLIRNHLYNLLLNDDSGFLKDFFDFVSIKSKNVLHFNKKLINNKILLDKWLKAYNKNISYNKKDLKTIIYNISDILILYNQIYKLKHKDPYFDECMKLSLLFNINLDILTN